jgi:hypothetical protein
MTSSRSFSSRIAIVLLLGIINVSGCASSLPTVTGDGAGAGVESIAVLPLDNLSGGSAPVKALRQELIARLKAKGLSVLPDELLDAFMALHRVRYVGGMNRSTSEAFRTEMGVSAVLVTSLELYNESYPPRIALTARLVATGDEPRIIRMDSTAMAGDDSPGILGIGLIEDPRVLRGKALDRLADALTGGEEGTGVGLALPPEALYRSQPLDPARRYSLAVLPFFNKSSRKYAGEILALHFLRELTRYPMFDVIEPGVIREQLLQYRIIMEEGVSLSDAEIMFGMLKSDLLLSGNVNDFEDTQGSFGAPKVDFSALLLDRESRKAVWAVNAHYAGDDRVYFFDYGRVTTASGLAAAITRGAIDSLYKEERGHPDENGSQEIYIMQN